MIHSKPAPQFNIVLIGYRAVGKTTVGALLARQLARPFVDLDTVFEQEARETIADFVRREGWPAFRRREKSLVQRFAAQNGQVIATGGGVILDPANVASLQATGKLIWLKAAPATIKARLSLDQQQTASRPGLTAQGTLDEVDEVLASREPLYKAAATVSLAVDTDDFPAVAQRLVDLVRAWEQEQS